MYFGAGSGIINVDDIKCSGYESDISDCSSRPWGTSDCSHSEDVGIDCYGYYILIMS